MHHCGSLVQLVITHLLITNQNNLNGKITVCIVSFKLNDLAFSEKCNGYGAFGLLIVIRFKILNTSKKCTEEASRPI